jgi:hypothetical protein
MEAMIVARQNVQVPEIYAVALTGTCISTAFAGPP